jgi:hypothetical protein
MAHSVHELIELARRVLEVTPDSEDFIARAERYSLAFPEWYTEFSSSPGATQKVSEKELNELNSLHQTILARAGGAKNDTSAALKNVRRQGKIMVRYIDTLPRQISVAIQKKG